MVIIGYTNTIVETVMAIKILIFVFLVSILYSLGSSLVFLVRDNGEGDRMVRRLSWRIGLSMVMIVFLWGAYQLGWIEPSGGPVHAPAAAQAENQ
jgi:hypothetical protein